MTWEPIRLNNCLLELANIFCRWCSGLMKHFFTPRNAASIAVVLWLCISQKNFQNSGENWSATLSTYSNHASCTETMFREPICNRGFAGRGNRGNGASSTLCLGLRQNLSLTIIPVVTIAIGFGAAAVAVAVGTAAVTIEFAPGWAGKSQTGRTQFPRPRRASCKQICLLPTIALKQTGHVHEAGATEGGNSISAKTIQSAEVHMHPGGVEIPVRVIDGFKSTYYWWFRSFTRLHPVGVVSSKPPVIDGSGRLHPLGVGIKTKNTDTPRGVEMARKRLLLIIALLRWQCKCAFFIQIVSV